MRKVQIAIDGPVSSGKSTVGRSVAVALHYLFVDTGLMYRAIAWKVKRKLLPREAWGEAAAESRFAWGGNVESPRMLIDNIDVTDDLTLPEISSLSSQVATVPQVRAVLVKAQQEMGREGGVVMVGRDIGMTVLPQAQVKIFLTASIDARALRRFQELQGARVDTTLEQVKADMLERDTRDKTRTDSPLQPAKDAIQLDSTHIGVEEVVHQIVVLAEKVV